MTQILHKIKNTFANALIVFISITVFSLFLEVAIRLTAKGVDLFNSTNFVTDRLTLFESTYPTAYHPNLGYIPRPGTTGANNRWGKSVTILEHGVRSNRDNGKAHDARGAIILAVGDSFTFGDFVSNRNTWPAHLDTLVKESVINGGVFGYGLDQTVLRAEELANFFSVKIALISC